MGLGWPGGLGWGLGWRGVGWAVGLAGLGGWVGLGWEDWAGLGVGWLAGRGGLSGPGPGRGWAGLGFGLGGLAETEIGLFEKWQQRVPTENMSFRMANSNKQFLFISFLRV